MFCPKCGKQIDDGAMFCPECGASLKQENPIIFNENGGPTNNQVTANKPKNKMVRYLIAIVAVVVVGYLGCRYILGIDLFGGSSSNYEKPIETIVDAMNDQDIEAFLSAIPEEIFDEYAKESGIDVKSIISLYSSQLKEEMFSEYEGCEFSYEISEVYDCSQDEIDEAKDELKSDFGVDLTISDAKILDLTFIITDSSGERDEDDGEIMVIEIDGSWYIEPSSFF